MLNALKKRILALAAALCLCPPLLCYAETPSAEEMNRIFEAQLSHLGYFTELPDETADEATRRALLNFQIANGLELTGTADEATAARLQAGGCVSKQEYLAAIAQRYADLKLEEGSVGDDVYELQRMLTSLEYYSGQTDGVFGAETGDAVAVFQMAVGLDATGVADGATLYRLFEGDPPDRGAFLRSVCAEKGDSGRHVKQVQQRLREMGYFDGECTGTYGEMTARAVELFQQMNELEPTGELDVETSAALYSTEAIRWSGGGIFHLGDTGEAVRRLQQRLARLGYYADTISGEFDVRTQTALCLLQIACGLETGEQAPAENESVVHQWEAVDAFRKSRASAGTQAADRAYEIALIMLGRDFAEEGKTLFPGFSFVQNVYAQSGVAFVEPGEIIGEATACEDGDVRIGAGRIVALERVDEGSMQMSLGISLGDGKLAYLDDAGRVVAGLMEQMDFQSAFVWALGGEDA